MKMNALLLGGFLSLCSGALWAKEVTRSYDFKDFDKLYLQGGGHYELMLGDKERVEITADEEVFEDFEIRQKGSSVHIGGHKAKLGWSWSSRDRENVRGVIVVKSLSELRAQGSVQVNAESFNGDELKLDIGGSSNLNIEKLTADEIRLDASGASQLNVESVHAENLSVSLSGSSRLNIKRSGSIAHQDADLSGASNYYAEHIESETAKVHASGASNARLNVNESISARLSGASNLHYKGDAKVEAHTSGASNVRTL